MLMKTAFMILFFFVIFVVSTLLSLFLLLLNCFYIMYMQGDYENLVKDKYGETSIAQDDNAPSTEFVAPQISSTEDAELFYRAAGGSKKGRVYGLGSEGVIMAITQRNSFVAPQPTQLQPTVDDIIAAPSFKKVVGEMLDERDRLAADRQRESEQQILQLRNQLSVVLATLTALGTQSSSNSNVVLAPTNQPANGSDQSPPSHAP